MRTIIYKDYTLLVEQSSSEMHYICEIYGEDGEYVWGWYFRQSVTHALDSAKHFVDNYALKVHKGNGSD